MRLGPAGFYKTGPFNVTRLIVSCAYYTATPTQVDACCGGTVGITGIDSPKFRLCICSSLRHDISELEVGVQAVGAKWLVDDSAIR